ncbi:response regulator transcription factor [Streptomyces sp. NPDC000070]|uniref:response regulator transcription factor n=1 Tax=Streptomyces sp. NPDC000070 TaxID=3154240 RepID=UPI00332BA696
MSRTIKVLLAEDRSMVREVLAALLGLEENIEAAARLHEELPAVKLVILTTFGRPGYLRSAMESGADAFLVKDAPTAQLAEAIRKVLAGERVIDPTLAAAAPAEGANPLTDREREVLRAAADGSTNAEPATALHLSRGTVRDHLSTATGKGLALRSGQFSIALAAAASLRTRSAAGGSTALTTSA